MAKKKQEFDIFQVSPPLFKSNKRWWFRDSNGSIEEIEYEPDPPKDVFLDGSIDEVADSAFKS